VIRERIYPREAHRAMPELMLTKSLGKLEPIDPEGIDYLRGISIGEIVKAKISKPRNGAFHRKHFALLQVGFQNQEQFDSFDDWRKAVTIEAGFYVDRRMFDGSTMREAKSLSYASMDSLEFARLFDSSLRVVANFIGTDNKTLVQEIQNFSVVGTG